MRHKIIVNQTTPPTIKLNYFEKILWPLRNNGFSDMNLTGVTTFPTSLIKYEKSISNQKIIFHVTKINPCTTYNKQWLQ